LFLGILPNAALDFSRSGIENVLFLPEEIKSELVAQPTPSAKVDVAPANP
jgi:hypothetical protein